MTENSDVPTEQSAPDAAAEQRGHGRHRGPVSVQDVPEQAPAPRGRHRKPSDERRSEAA
ncbi:hypothetical protein QIS99_13990 [Streptomyces sp. B-S-A8]|uniref:Uncharacterized protein n=1 Tax=Streptomyces solicavernae TaxID=3043614 RepID=A0ABT6RS82_9ACTN|nr:hypothetical protein [Streptomyces sp. B-S-A8]MDI3387303.1 hypothetical protein [Streptomyces sp. B-S-A8]